MKKITQVSSSSSVKNAMSKMITIGSGTHGEQRKRKFVRKSEKFEDSHRKQILDNKNIIKNENSTNEQELKKNEYFSGKIANRIIRANSYLKLLQCSLSKKKLDKQRVITEQTDSEPITPIRIESSKSSTNLFGVCGSNKSNRKLEEIIGKARIEKTRKPKKKDIDNIETGAQTNNNPESQRDIVKREKHMEKEIRLMKKQIVILEAENQRLKKQIQKVTKERDTHQLQREIVETYSKAKHQQISMMEMSIISLISAVKKQLSQINSQIDQSQCCQPINISSEIGSQYNSIELSSTTEKPLSINKFTEQFLEPISKNIQAALQHYRSAYQQYKLKLSKMEIKHDIMKRSSLESNSLKIQIKALNEKVNFEKEKANKYKEMYEKMKKISKDIHNISGRKSMNVIRESEWGEWTQWTQVKAKRNQFQEDFVFLLSDRSED